MQWLPVIDKGYWVLWSEQTLSPDEMEVPHFPTDSLLPGPGHASYSHILHEKEQ